MESGLIKGYIKVPKEWLIPFSELERQSLQAQIKKSKKKKKKY